MFKKLREMLFGVEVTKADEREFRINMKVLKDLEMKIILKEGSEIQQEANGYVYLHTLENLERLPQWKNARKDIRILQID